MKRRLITGGVILAVAIPLLLLGGWFTVLFASLIGWVGVSEILRTTKDKRFHPMVYVLTILGCFAIMYWPIITNVFTNFGEIISDNMSFIPKPYTPTENIYLILFYLIALLSTEVASHSLDIWDTFYLFMMTTFISVAASAIIFIREELNPSLIFFIFACSWGCDASAFLWGKLFGKHLMAPTISPKKTWEGAIGGIITVTSLSLLYFKLFPFTAEPYGYALCVVMAFIFSIGAILGDLIFSSLKRHLQIKDFGRLLPGHGGVLDRVDSLLTNILLFMCMYYLYFGVIRLWIK